MRSRAARCPPPELRRNPLPSITKLYPSLELFSDGEPPRHTLFVFGRGVGPGSDDELLLVDPPLNAAEFFVLPPRAAAIFTAPPVEAAPLAGVALVATQPGGLAHLRIGEHLLDIYSQAQSNVVLLPLLGILCGGGFGSDVALPRVASGSDGQGELDVLRLLAMLVRERKVQLYLPHLGASTTDPMAMMERLADDVGYIHGLRRVVPPLVQSGNGLERVLALAQTLLPQARDSAPNGALHAANVAAIFAATNYQPY